MTGELPIVWDLIVAALIGLAVGAEREWSGHVTGPDARFAGMRTFAVIGGIGGIAGWWLQQGLVALAAVTMSALCLFAVAAYVATLRRPDTTTDGTTEIATVAVAALGVVSGLGQRAIAGGAAALLVFLLAEKTKLQQLLRRVDPHEMRAALLFAVLAMVVFPLVPEGEFGPYGAFRPRQLWFVVLLFSGLNFVGYIARRIIGETRGLAMTGLLGGLVSSTAVSLTFSRRSRDEPHLSLPLALGIVAACTMLLPRIFVMATVLQNALSMPLLPFLLPPFIVGIAVIALALWLERDTRDGSRTENGESDATSESHDGSRGQIEFANPLGLKSAMQMAVAFQLVLFVVAWLQDSVGSPGIIATAAVLGLTDMDALTVSMTRVASDTAMVRTAALAIAVGVLSNTVLKASLALAIGTHPLKLRVGGALGAMAVASIVGFWLGTR